MDNVSDVSNVPDYLNPNPPTSETSFDIKTIARLPNQSKPEEAAKNLDNAQITGLNPTGYKDVASSMDAAVEDDKKPTSTTPGYGRWLASSSEHTALGLQDNEHFSYAERVLKLITDYAYDRPNASQKVIDLSNRKLNYPDHWTDDDEIALMYANQANKDMGQKDYGLDGPIEGVPPWLLKTGELTAKGIGTGLEVAGAIKDQVKAGLIGTVEAKAKSSMFRGSSPLGVGGAALSFSYAVLKKFYDDMAGSAYNEQPTTTESGQPISEETRRTVAKGVGVVGAGIQGLMTAGGMSATPLVSKFLNPVLARTIVSSPLMAAVAKTVAIIGTQYGEGFAGNAAIETSKVLGEEIAKHYDGTDASFLNAITSFADNAETHGPRILQAANAGGILQGSLGAIGAGFGFMSTKSRYARAGEIINDYRASNAKDVTPVAPLELNAPGTPSGAPGKTPKSPAPTGGAPDLNISLPTGESPVNQAAKAIYFNEAAKNISKALENTNMSKVAPGRVSEAMQSIAEASGAKKLYVAVGDLVNDPKRLDKVRGQLDPNGLIDGSDMGAFFEVQPHHFFSMVKDDPALADMVRLEPDAPTLLQAKDYIQKMEDAHSVREKVLNQLDSEPLPAGVSAVEKKRLTEQAITEAQRALMPINGVGDIQAGIDWHGDNLLQGPEEYLNTNTFGGVLDSVIPKAEKARFNEAQLEARKETLNQLQSEDYKRMFDLRADEIQTQQEFRDLQETKRMESDPNRSWVRKFELGMVFDGDGNINGNIYAINPKPLRAELAKLKSPNTVEGRLRADYLVKILKDERLQEHGMFKGDLSPNDAAQLLGLPDGKAMLDIFSRTPSTKEMKRIVQARTGAQAANDQRIIDANHDYDETDLIKSLNTANDVHYRELQFMKDHEWPSLKGGFKRIALPLKSPAELGNLARTAVENTALKDLNVNQWKIGERRSQRAAVNAITENHVELAFQNKQNAMMAIEMQKETLKAQAEVIRGKRIVKRLNDPANSEILRKAGPKFEKAWYEISDVFNLSDTKKGGIQDSYQKWVKQMHEAGRGDFGINPELSDIRQRASDMTVAQFSAVTYAADNILQQAKLHDTLLLENSKGDTALTFSQKKENIVSNLKAHPDYNEKRLKDTSLAKPSENALRKIQTTATITEGMKHVAMIADREIAGGDNYQWMIEPVTGEGDHRGVQGQSFKVDKLVANLDHDHALMKKYFKNGEYEAFMNEWLTIPELAHVKVWNDGSLKKMDWLKLYTNMGDPDGRVNLEKAAPLDVWKKVMEREFETRHVKYMHESLPEVMASYWRETLAIEREEGRNPTQIKGVPYEHKGEIIPGGYVAQWYITDFDVKAVESFEKQLQRASENLLGDGSSQMDYNWRSSMTVEQRRLQARMGSNQMLDPNYMRKYHDIEETVHYLANYRPIRDIIKLLKDADIRNALISAVSKPSYEIYFNSVKQLANFMENKNKTLFHSQDQVIKSIFGHQKAAMVAQRIAGVIGSFGIQFAGGPVVLHRAGASIIKHYMAEIRDMAKNPFNIPAMVKQARELDSSLRQHDREVGDSMVLTYKRAMADTRLTYKWPIVDPVLQFMKLITSTGMGYVGKADAILKTATSRALFRQFMAGDVRGFPIKRVMEMTVDERVNRASAYASQISELTLTRNHDALDKSPFEKNEQAHLLSYFFIDARQDLNAHAATGRRVKWEARDAIKNVKEGNYGGLGKNAKGLMGILAGYMIWSSIKQLVEDYRNGWDNEFMRKHKMVTWDDRINAFKKYAGQMITDPFADFMESHPFVRNIYYAAFNNQANKDKFTKKATLPYDQMQTKVATGLSIMADMLEINRAKPSDKELVAILEALGYITGDMPVKGTQQILNLLEHRKTDSGGGNIIYVPTEELHHTIEEYKKEPPKGATKEFIKQLDDLDKRIYPKSPPESARSSVNENQ